MRKSKKQILLASILVAGITVASPLYAEGGGMQNEQCGMMHGHRDGMMGRGGMMQGGHSGMMGQGGSMMHGDQGRMMQGRKEEMIGMIKQMSQMMKQMSQMMDRYSDMMSNSQPNEQDKGNAASEPEKK